MMAPHARRLQGIASVLLVFGGLLLGVAASSLPEDAQWIWSPAYRSPHVPEGACYFRKTFSVEDVREGEIVITCDDGYTLHVNGRQVGSGHVWRTLDRHDITSYLVRGQNVVAVRATNDGPGSAGLVARIVVQRAEGGAVTYPTGPDWKTSLKEDTGWSLPTYTDSQWLPAQSFGRLGSALPWGYQVRMVGEHGRFRAPPDFHVEWIVGSEATGSLIALTFTEHGQMVAAREGGPLLLISDTNQDGVHETVADYCDQVTNCQGLLALDGTLLAVGDGPEGAALYRLSDKDGDAHVEAVEALVKFRGATGEHGPHAVRLGPEGLIYLAVGHSAQLQDAYAPTSPHRHFYEGDLVQPRYEDPGAHTADVKAPGGAILRTDASGSFVELVAGGLRNPYDIAFNDQGDLFAYDSDMERDIGMPWYRPSRINHVTAGAELGWRSGWSKWPEYYIDSLPAMLHMGRGAPTGVAFYDHVMYPARYHGAMFACDWARGCIDVVQFTADGSTYRGKAEVFIEGRPLPATGIAVGPDGWLYFCTGGRGTTGGIYRVVWSGRIPTEVVSPGEGIEQALRQPQLCSAWARRRVADVQRDLGDKWDSQLAAIAASPAHAAAQRTRALDLMQLLGPPPAPDLLRQVSKDKDAQVRAKATYLMGVQGSDGTARRLADLLNDPDPVVRRLACESVVRGRYEASPSRLIALLADPDRFVAYAARRALEKLPPNVWQQHVLSSSNPRVFLQGSTALLVAHPSTETARAVLDRCLTIVRGGVRQPGFPEGFISDQDFTDLLRVVQLALIRGKLTGDQVPKLRQALTEEFPSRDATMNRELARLLVYLGDPATTPRLIEPLRGNLPMVEKIHFGMVASLIEAGWTTGTKLELLAFLDQARQANGGAGLGPYLDGAAGRMAARLTDAERRQVLQKGPEWPSAAFAVLTKMPPDPGLAAVHQLEQLDRQMEGVPGDAAQRLRLAIVAVLGRSRDEKAMAYLRQVFAADPSRREAVAMGLAQEPGGENWPLLVQSLSVLDGVAAVEVLAGLAKEDRTPDGPETLRQVILCGLRTGARGGPLAVKLLTKWTGKPITAENEPWDVSLPKWQAWFVQTYPDLPPPRPPEDSHRSKWTYAELLGLLDDTLDTTGDSQSGATVFHRARCAGCHRYGGQGGDLGPDLTTISQRLHRKEILESVLFPAHVVADQYASKILITTDGHTFAGIPTQVDDDALVLLQASGGPVRIATERIDQIAPALGSVMPDGLVNVLTLQQVADLFAFLGKPPRTNVTSRRGVGSSQ